MKGVPSSVCEIFTKQVFKDFSEVPFSDSIVKEQVFLDPRNHNRSSSPDIVHLPTRFASFTIDEMDAPTMVSVIIELLLMTSFLLSIYVNMQL